MTGLLPRYPVYVPSKGRAHVCQTAKFLIRDGVPFKLVVEPQEADLYARRFGAERLLVLPWDNPPGTREGLIKARNWIRDHAEAAGHKRHWQLDDNIVRVRRWYKAHRIPCASGYALRVTEDFVDRYENVAIAGLAYTFFVLRTSSGVRAFTLNVHVYSCSLILNAIPYRWRLAYNDDTDICLQALVGGWCTVLVNAFSIQKLRTMTVSGGNTGIYQGDGRLRMARSLERQWPYVVKTKRRFGRPQHRVRGEWGIFTTQLRPRPGLDIEAEGLAHSDDELRLIQAKPTVRSAELRALMRLDAEKKDRVGGGGSGIA